MRDAFSDARPYGIASAGSRAPPAAAGASVLGGSKGASRESDVDSGDGSGGGFGLSAVAESFGSSGNVD